MVWVCDFTYIRAANRFYNLCAVLDLFARKIVFFKLSDRINTKLAIDTVNIALSTTGCHTGSCFILTGVLSSPLKNPGNILIPLILFGLFPLKGILNGFYNSVRPHSHNNDPSPNQKEALFMPVWFFVVYFIDISPMVSFTTCKTSQDKPILFPRLPAWFTQQGYGYLLDFVAFGQLIRLLRPVSSFCSSGYDFAIASSLPRFTAWNLQVAFEFGGNYASADFHRRALICPLY